jgi:hypothetical protein
LYSEFVFQDRSKAFSAFKNIGRGPQIFEGDGLHEVKLMGAGAGNGFSILPNLKRYAIVFFFDTIEHLNAFVKSNVLFNWYWENSSQRLAAILKPFKGHGFWSGEVPFDYQSKPPGESEHVAVITRATIHTKWLLDFWRNVPKVASFMHSAPAMHQVGIGEYPLFMQATFSIWENVNELRKTAYTDTVHADVVKKTRERGWYKEELFAEFRILELTAAGKVFEKLGRGEFKPLESLK